MQRLHIYHEPSSCGNTYDHYGGRTYFKHCHHGNGDIPLHVNCTITTHVPHTPLPWEHPALHSVAMEKKAPTAIYLLLLWKHPALCAFCCYRNGHFLHLVTMVQHVLLCCLAPTLLPWTHPPSLHGRACHPVPSFSVCGGHTPAPPSPAGCWGGGRGCGSAGSRLLPEDRRQE